MQKKYKQNKLCYFQNFKQPSDTSLVIKGNKVYKLNEYISNSALPYFNSFCQPFHIPFFYYIFDQSLFC